MQLKNLVPMLSVVDVERSLTFYQEALQFEVLHRYEENGHVQWACVKSGETALMFARCEVAQSVLPLARKEDLVLYFYPDDVESLHATLQAKGYGVSALRHTFYGMKECLLTDPDGYHLSFGQAMVVPPTA
jgi:uncharacterized glyoxalase superfamily protein PhnB